MKTFEEKKTYTVNGGGAITVEKKTAHYLTFSGDYSGKKKIHRCNPWGLGELIVIDGYRFVYAANEKNQNEKRKGEKTMNEKNYADIPEGTVIKALGITATVKKVIYSEVWRGEYDIEFIDTLGNYRHYKQWDDGGKVTFPNKEKRLINYYGTDCTDLFKKYGMI